MKGMHARQLAEGYERLVAMYAEAHRHYHILRHIEDCLREFDSVRHLAREPEAVELAIWFHDAVYDSHAGDNEERSAELAKDWLSQGGATSGLVDAVVRLVLATKKHDASLHVDAPILVDVDLSILGQAPERYWEYEAQIRREYEWVPAAVFAEKRGEILEGFLARERIYKTEEFFGRLEKAARANLRAAVGRLRGKDEG